VYLYRRKHASDVLPLPVSRWWSLLASPFRQAPAPLCETTDMGWCMTRCACLLPQLLPITQVVHSSLPQRADSGWVGLGAWFRTHVVYPSKDSHPPRH